MNLIEESYIQKQQRPKKIKRIILIIIIILLIAIFAIIGVLLSLREKPLIAYINGNQNNQVLDALKIQEDGTIYVSIKKFASYVGYEAFSGKYEEKSEETNKCYVQSSNEVVNLSLNNKRIYQLDLSTKEDEDYRYYDMREQVVSKDGELCVRSNEIEQVFNTRLTYDKENNRIIIETLPYLIQEKSADVLNYGYEMIDEKFANQKTIFSNMLIVTKNEKKSYGIIDSNTGEILVEAKYSDIEYLPNIGDCIVEDNKKFGIVSPKEVKKTKIQVNYDSIDLVDKDAGLYVVGKDGKYGIIDLKGNSRVPVEYDKIGIDPKEFQDNHIDNKYLLVDNLIPVMKDGLWGMLDKRGNAIVPLVFDSYGYVATSNKNAMSLLVVPDYEVIIVCKNKKYGLMNKSGERILDVIADDIFMTYENGENKYYINANNSQVNLLDYLDQVGGRVNTDVQIQNQQSVESQQAQDQENQNQEEQQGEEQIQQEQDSAPEGEQQ